MAMHCKPSLGSEFKSDLHLCLWDVFTRESPHGYTSIAEAKPILLLN